MLRVADKFADSDTGRQRRVNEDSYFVRSPLFVVADGMGGAQAGEVASRTAVSLFEPDLGADGGSVEHVLAERVRQANSRIHALSQDNAEQAGMGTTLTAVYVGAEEVSIAHVGDSRAYLFRDGDLLQLTDDHSLVSELVRKGELTPEEAEDHPQRSIITRALGPEPVVEVDTRSYRARAGDIFLLCSDGLTGMVSSEGVAEILRAEPDLRRSGRALVQAANQAGGKDNITVVLLRLEEVAAPPRDADHPTLIGASAPTADEVRSALAEQASSPPRAVAPADAQQAADAQRADAQRAAPAPHAPRTQHAPPAQHATPPVMPRVPRRPAPAGPAPKRRLVRRLTLPLSVLAILAIVLFAGYIASQSVYFLGTDAQGFVTMYRGVPYQLPLHLRLYTGNYASGVPAAALSVQRRNSLLNHKLRSHDDAADLVRKLELGQLGGQ